MLLLLLTAVCCCYRHEAEKDMVAKRVIAKQQYKDTEDALKAFLREFNPKRGMTTTTVVNGSSSSSSITKQEFKTSKYVQSLRAAIPASSRGVWHHSVGLSKALAAAAGSTLAYINPFQCCCRAGGGKDQKEE